jgi:excisionase family DNA binding protein
MISFNPAIFPLVLNNHISVQVAAKYSGYSLQHLRRLLCNGKFEGVKIGQIWMVDKGAFDRYLEQAQNAADHRFVPK